MAVNHVGGGRVDNVEVTRRHNSVGSLTNSVADRDDEHHTTGQLRQEPDRPQTGESRKPNRTEDVSGAHGQGEQIERQNRPTNVTVKTKLIMKEDRICRMLEANGDKIGKAIELAAFAIVALVVVASSAFVTMWGALVFTALQYYEWPPVLVVALCSLAALVGGGTTTMSWIQKRIHMKKDKKQSYASFVVHSSTASCTDVSGLADF